MNDSAIESAAQYLLAARRRGTPGPRIPEADRPSTAADGLAIQARLAALIAQPIGGYKCSAPTEPRPVACAPIFAPAIATTSSYAVQGTGGTARVEPEIAFVIGRDLPARATPYNDNEVRDAIGEARFALEIMGSRYADPASAAFPELLADFISNQGLFVGPALADPWQRRLEAFPLTIRAGDSVTSGVGPPQAASCAPSGGSEAATAASVGVVFATRDGKHPDGHPLRPLYWLANYLAAQGNPLRAGQIVTTGSYCGVIDAPLGKPLTFTYGDLGSLSVTLTRA
jgi:2-keto-4-pentenoate hydratase